MDLTYMYFVLDSDSAVSMWCLYYLSVLGKMGIEDRPGANPSSHVVVVVWCSYICSSVLFSLLFNMAIGHGQAATLERM